MGFAKVDTRSARWKAEKKPGFGPRRRSERTLFIAPIDKSCSMTQIQQHFEPSGSLDEIRILCAYAFVTFKEAEHAKEAHIVLDGSYLAKRKLSIVFAEIPEPTHPAPTQLHKAKPSIPAPSSPSPKRKRKNDDAFDPKRGKLRMDQV
ncbi:hypothetical protein BDY24DRAFT_66279 [Mrakia frigida]|uniref:RNA recognition motif domain-containing protein n=1 Tax=Mrakia frigida TaxID=29902 RepID=UPI003FCC11D5